MALGILQNTPYWVWGIFLLLLVLGLSQTRARKVSANAFPSIRSAAIRRS